MIIEKGIYEQTLLVLISIPKGVGKIEIDLFEVKDGINLKNGKLNKETRSYYRGVVLHNDTVVFAHETSTRSIPENQKELIISELREQVCKRLLDNILCYGINKRQQDINR